VTGFADGDVNLTASTEWRFETSTVTGSGMVYDVSVTGMSISRECDRVDRRRCR
jgi:hypothetical protein